MRAIIGIRCTLALIATLLFTFQQGLAQNTSQQELLKLAATDPPYVIDALVTSLPEEGLQAEVIQKLLQFLDDDRMVVEHLMGRETVSSRVAMKLHLLASTSVETIVAELPKLTTNRSKQLALEVIASIGGPNAEAYSALLLWCYEKDVVLRSRAIAALSAVGVDDSTTVQQLGRFLKDPHPYVRGVTIETLIPKHHLVDPFLKEIISLLDDESEVFMLASKDMMISQRIQESVAKLLALKGPSAKAAIPRLWVLTGADYPTNVRIWSAAGLCNVAESPPEEAMQLLGQLLLLDRDEEFWMNDAPEAIAILGGKGKSLLENLEQAKSHKSAAMRSRLSEAFFALDPATAVSRILPLMDDDDEGVAVSVIESLSSREISEPRVMQAYLRALKRTDSPFDEPAHSAVMALGKLGPRAIMARSALQHMATSDDISETLKDDVKMALKRIPSFNP